VGVPINEFTHMMKRVEPAQVSAMKKACPPDQEIL
jgi:hypothetical protein